MEDKEIEQLAVDYAVNRGADRDKKAFRTITNRDLYDHTTDCFTDGFKNAQELLEPKWISVDFVNELLRLDNPWPLVEVIKKLVEASDILLHQKDYDRMGWEEHEHAFREGKKILELLNRQLPSPPQLKDK